MSKARLDAVRFNAIPWHDAEIVKLGIDLADGGEALVMLRCTLHPDEPRDVLLALGIATITVDLRFTDAWGIRLTLHANTTQRELIDRWEVTASAAGGSFQCHISGSAGSSLDMSVGGIWVEEASV